MSAGTANLGFTKLIVDDLDGTIQFYSSVFKLSEVARIDDKMAGRPMVEVIFAPAHQGGASLVIMKWLDGDRPGKNQAVLVMLTDDVDDCARRAADLGATITEEPNDRDQARVAFIEDHEGNLVEVAQLFG